MLHIQYSALLTYYDSQRIYAPNSKAALYHFQRDTDNQLHNKIPQQVTDSKVQKVISPESPVLHVDAITGKHDHG